MEKLKLKIKGLDSKSDSELIEKKLKKQSGVEMPKFNHESGKGVVIYDKNRSHEKDICQLIRKMGDYEIISDKPELKNEDSVGEKKSSGHDKDKDKNEDGDKNKNEEKYLGSYINNPMILGIFVGVSVMSIIINVIFLVMITSN